MDMVSNVRKKIRVLSVRWYLCEVSVKHRKPTTSGPEKSVTHGRARWRTGSHLVAKAARSALADLTRKMQL